MPTEKFTTEGILDTISVHNRCSDSSRVVTPQEHAADLTDWLSRSGPVYEGDPTQDYSWAQVCSWLSLAAGLVSVDIDLTGPDSYLCSSAGRYQSVAGKTASRVHTELTRLLYAYCALENAVNSLTGSINAQVVPAARKMLDTEGAPTLLHSGCEVEHLFSHIVANPAWVSDPKMLKQFVPASGSAFSTVPMQVGVKYRHVFAHGAIKLPDPVPAQDGWVTGGGVQACMARRATTCLLMSLQSLFWCGLQRGILWDLDEPRELRREILMPAVGASGEESVFEVTAEEHLSVLHLTPGGE